MMDRKDSVCALLVGEYEESRLLIHEIFRDCGWRLIEARDRKAALEHLDRERIHVVITNSESPGTTWRHWLRILSQRVRPPQLIVTSRKADDHLWSDGRRNRAFVGGLTRSTPAPRVHPTTPSPGTPFPLYRLNPFEFKLMS